MIIRPPDPDQLLELAQRVREVGQHGPVVLQGVADAFVLLQQARQSADYDPGFELTKSDASKHARDAATAISQLRTADRAAQKEFLARLIFELRKN